MIYYIYKITHPSGRTYIGKHATDNINDGYMGSGKWVKSIKDKSVLKKEGIAKWMSLEEYNKQKIENDLENTEWVHITSRIGRKRKLLKTVV